MVLSRNKTYDLSNHLGNVMVTVSDKRKGIDMIDAQGNPVVDVNGNYVYEDGIVDGYFADVVSATDYYPFGSTMPGRKFASADKYRYGFGSQEKTDEISGAGNHYTATYWEYDPRLGRRWNLDPVVVPWESGYAVFRNNPIALNDPYGDCPDCPDPETIGSKSEKTAQGIINRHGGARGIGKDLGSGDFSLTDEETNLLYTKNDDGDITGFSTIGHQVQSIIKDQAYLEKFNTDAGSFLNGLANSGGLSNAELTELSSMRSGIVSRTKAEYMMAIFSPDNVGTILFMSLGTGSAGLQSKAASFSPKFAQSSAKVWSSISSAAPNMAGTQIPKYFTLNGKYFVNPNATKHMAEYVARFGVSHSIPLRSQLTLSSFRGAVNQITKQGNLVMGKMYKAGNWEVMFSKARIKGGLPVIKHARMLK